MIVFLKIMMIATLTIITFNLDSSKSFEGEKIIKAVKKLDGIEIELENLNDAKEAVHLILARTDVFEKHAQGKFKQVKVTSSRKYETTAVDYKMIFLLEFRLKVAFF